MGGPVEIERIVKAFVMIKIVIEIISTLGEPLAMEIERWSSG
jgi:hypothetical protein